MKRILVVCAIDSTAWILLRRQLGGLRSHGWEVSIACSDGPYLTRLAAEGYKIHPIRISRSYSPTAHLLAVARLYSLLRRYRYDIVHVHTPVAGLVGRLAAFLARTPIILYTAHGFYFHEHMAPRVRAVHVLLERLAGKCTRFLFTQSAEDAATAVREKIMPESRIEVIGNGVALDEFDSVPDSAVSAWRARLRVTDGATVVGTMGRLVEEKGYREFFEAARILAAIHPRALFLVVGDVAQGDRGTFPREIISRIERDPELRDRVRFTGFTEDIPALMQVIDVFVLASYREGMPRSIIEAMAAGRPVVASDIRGCREEVVDGVTGYLVPVRDAAALADRIGELIVDPILRLSLGRAGRLRAEELFSEDRVVEHLERTIDRLLEEDAVGVSAGC